MLRRNKKDVENELGDKVEILLYCPLTIRQKLLYVGLKRKIRIEELLQNLGSQSQINSSLNTSLMNLVMQFRKVGCNTLNKESIFVLELHKQFLFHINIVIIYITQRSILMPQARNSYLFWGFAYGQN